MLYGTLQRCSQELLSENMPRIQSRGRCAPRARCDNYDAGDGLSCVSGQTSVVLCDAATRNFSLSLTRSPVGTIFTYSAKLTVRYYILL